VAAAPGGENRSSFPRPERDVKVTNDVRVEGVSERKLERELERSKRDVLDELKRELGGLSR
jgi:hypothetical protein